MNTFIIFRYKIWNSFKSISFKSIEIHNDDIGAPVIKMNIDRIDNNKLKVSISHAGEYAIATAIIVI